MLRNYIPSSPPNFKNIMQDPRKIDFLEVISRFTIFLFSFIYYSDIPQF